MNSSEINRVWPIDFPVDLDAIVTGVGTGGHITGCARVLKKTARKC